MKRHIKFLLHVVCITLFMSSCSPNSPELPQQSDNTDDSEYYVKYSISSSFYKFGSISYADVRGTVTERTGNYSNTSTKWSVTIGPVKKGFRASVRYDRGTADEVKLEVSKNGSPFALKAKGDKSASYTIDY